MSNPKPEQDQECYLTHVDNNSNLSATTEKEKTEVLVSFSLLFTTEPTDEVTLSISCVETTTFCVFLNHNAVYMKLSNCVSFKSLGLYILHPFVFKSLSNYIAIIFQRMTGMALPTIILLVSPVLPVTLCNQ